MSNANDMAFPVLDRTQTPNETTQLGLTKREAFAMAAMQGFLSHYDGSSPEWYARNAVKHADLLLAELAK